MTQQLSLYQYHVERWRDCRLCPLAKTRIQVVIGKGTVPCDVLFVGEAPGDSEDVNGLPFFGQAGQRFDSIVERALSGLPGADRLELAYTNLLGCIPKDEGGNKLDKPDHDHIDACRPRLEEFIRMAEPKLIVTLGDYAEDYLTQGFRHSVKVEGDVPIVHAIHPSAILRAKIAQKGLMVQRCVVVIRTAVVKLLESMNANREGGTSCSS